MFNTFSFFAKKYNLYAHENLSIIYHKQTKKGVTT